jgi:hypothetical protein
LALHFLVSDKEEGVSVDVDVEFEGVVIVGESESVVVGLY